MFHRAALKLTHPVMLTFFACLAFFPLTPNPIPAAEPATSASTFPAFEAHTIDRIGASLGQTALADVDKDGDLDWIVGQSASRGGDIWWWEYQAPDKWLRHNLGKGNTDVGGDVYDVNNDGWIDMFSGSKLLINSGNPREQAFSVYEIGAVASHDSAFADVNGDGKMDALANSDKAGLFWYEIPADPTKGPWISHTIATLKEQKNHAGVFPKAVGDLDGDGDPDVVTAQAWYENADGKGLQWRQHKNIDFGAVHQYGIAVRTWVCDLDGDSDLDFVQAEADNPDARVAWFENDGKAHWTRHIIKDKGPKQDYHTLAVADFDNDGDLDVFSGGGPLSASGSFTVFIWENTAGPKKNPGAKGWKEHIVSRKHCHEAVAADVDRDGDIDICFKPWHKENEHIYLRNMLVERKK